MNKIIKIILTSITIVLCLFLKNNIISASELTETFSGYYWDRQNSEGYHGSGSFRYYYIDGKDSFCLDPTVHEGSPLYVGEWEQTGLPEDIRKRVTLIAYYGYNYPNHQTLEYRAATQAMIWETVTGKDNKVIFTTQRFGEGEELNITKERQEIENLIYKNSILPSFIFDVHRAQMGQKVELIDNNNVLYNYDISINNSTYDIVDNKLIINIQNDSRIEGRLNKKNLYKYSYTIFVGGGYQSQIVPGLTGSTTAYFNIDVYYGKLDITKRDSETFVSQGESTLEGATYGVYEKVTNKLITTIITDENGNATTGEILPVGSYYLKELESSKGYKLDKNIYYFEMNGTPLVHIDVSEDVVKGRIRVKKLDYDTNSCSSAFIGTEYYILDNNGMIVDIVTIDDSCTAISRELPYGNYRVVEIINPKSYELDTNMYDVFIDNSLDKEVVSLEKVIKNKINIFKQYETNNKNLNGEPNIIFEIFSIDNIKYGEIVTDDSGYANIDLPYGTWIFHQVNTLPGYEKVDDFNITISEISDKEQFYNIINKKISAYLKVTKIDSETKKIIELPNISFKILNLDTGEYVSEFINGEEQNIFYTNDNGIIITKTKLDYGHYKLIEIDSPKGYVLNNEGLEFTIDDKTNYDYIDNERFININFENKRIKGKIEIIKTGEKFIINNNQNFYDYQFLEGVRFRVYAAEDILSSDNKNIYYSSGKLVETLTTDSKGYAVSKDLPLGKYYITETNTLDGYILPSEKYYFELKENDKNNEIVYETYKKVNYLKKGSLDITKIDSETNKGISNTTISIYTENNELVVTDITDENGKIRVDNLPLGKYYIIENKASEGYILSDERITFELTRSKQVVKIIMKNEPIFGSLEFLKQDSLTGEPLKDTIIELYNNDKLISTYTTDDEGKILIEKLKYGKYYIIEKKAPIGYILDDEKIYFEIIDDKVIKITKINEKIKSLIQITKVNQDNEVLPGVIIGIYDQDDNLIYEGSTNEEGIIELELGYGKYYIIEKKAPIGYMLDDEKIYFEIIDDKVIKITKTNEKIKSLIQITKVNQDNEVLPGVIIGIYDQDDNLIYEGSTNEEGIIELELEYGKYYYKEIESIDGYILSEEKVFFEIDGKSDKLEFTLVNNIQKIDVPNTEKNKNVFLSYISYLLILLGNIIIYVKK